VASAERSEASTRTELIDAQLARAGWSKSRRTLVEEMILHVEQPDSAYRHGQFADYVLLGSDGQPWPLSRPSERLAMNSPANAKRPITRLRSSPVRPSIRSSFLPTARNPVLGSRPLPAEKDRGFYTRDDLETLRHQQRHAQPLGRRDQRRHRRSRLPERSDPPRHRRHRCRQTQFLLVMATGTGKTRTTIALVDTLLRAKRAQRVLFLADRRELVRQAMSEFKSHLPNESLARIESGETSGARIQFSTYPSMMQVYAPVSRLLRPDHRRREPPLDLPALQGHLRSLRCHPAGPTATPDRLHRPQHFRAVRLWRRRAQLLLQLRAGHRGRKPRQLPGTGRPNQLPAQGHSGRRTARTPAADGSRPRCGTRRTQLRRQRYRERRHQPGHQRCHGARVHGQEPQGYSWPAAQGHHLRRQPRTRQALYESFNRLYPELQRQGMAEIIDSHMERADATLDDFKYRTMPRVAISVDMLDTGMDVPPSRTWSSPNRFQQGQVLADDRARHPPAHRQSHWRGQEGLSDHRPLEELSPISSSSPMARWITPASRYRCGCFRLRLEKWQLAACPAAKHAACRR
jgi:type I restriction enzyme R subunit